MPRAPPWKASCDDGHVVRGEVRPERVLVEGAERDADVVDVAAANGRSGVRGAAVRDVPEHDQRGAAPDLFHADAGVGRNIPARSRGRRHTSAWRRPDRRPGRRCGRCRPGRRGAASIRACFARPAGPGHRYGSGMEGRRGGRQRRRRASGGPARKAARSAPCLRREYFHQEEPGLSARATRVSPLPSGVLEIGSDRRERAVFHDAGAAGGELAVDLGREEDHVVADGELAVGAGPKAMIGVPSGTETVSCLPL